MFVLKMAGLNIGVSARYRYTYSMCSEYMTNETNIHFTVSVSEDEIEMEQTRQPHGEAGYCEFVCRYRAICKKLPRYDRMLMHGAAIEREGRGYLFAAKSGTGKTTHIRLWKELYGDVEIINGDKHILRFDGGRIAVCGTPWCGKEGYQRNAEAPLSALCFLRRGEDNIIERITPDRAIDLLFTQILIPEDGTAASKTLDMCSELLERTPTYMLYCNMEKTAAEVAYKKMSCDVK